MVGKRERAMSITEELAKILALVDRPGDFYVVGRTELLVPRIEVEGVGLIALPPTFPSTMTIEELGATVAPL